MNTPEPGTFASNVRCKYCNDLIGKAEVKPDGTVACRDCTVFFGVQLGNGYEGHYDDDPSGGSGSWDQCVKLYEGNYEREKK